jgi:hypothetical protein
MPTIEIPENPTIADLQFAALCAENECDRLLAEAHGWRELAHKLHDRVDRMKERR